LGAIGGRGVTILCRGASVLGRVLSVLAARPSVVRRVPALKPRVGEELTQVFAGYPSLAERHLTVDEGLLQLGRKPSLALVATTVSRLGTSLLVGQSVARQLFSAHRPRVALDRVDIAFFGGHIAR
jgi:hypothetical protein